MSGLKRIYVEKKEGFNGGAEFFLNDLRENYSIGGLTKLRVVNVYDCDNMTGGDFEKCVPTVFSEPPIDNVYKELPALSADDFAFSVKPLPGQFDQRADSAVMCARAVTGNDNAVIECSAIYICSGKTLTDDEKSAIKKYFINPVEAMETGLKAPESLVTEYEPPAPMESIDGFINMDDSELEELRKRLGLAMRQNDILFCRDYFKNSERRDVTETEIRVIDTYWSDHCRHTTFLTAIDNIEFCDGAYRKVIEDTYNMYISERNRLNIIKKISLMDIATIGMKSLRERGLLPDLDESDEINACSINIDVDVNGETEKWLLQFKNETHNHPTEIEPFGGAATCLGGAIRDPLSGRAYVYQAMRITGSGDPRTPVSETITGKLPQRKITRAAAGGYSSYGNQIGVATGMVREFYDEGYAAKRLELGAVIGAAKKDCVVREKPEPGDIVVLVGGRTGRDGCGGATGSSKKHDDKSLASCGAEVQKGNPPVERKLQRLFRNPDAARLIKRCNDFGAGGVSVAIGELADGLDIYLDRIPKKYEGLSGTELAISESQERMAVVIAESDFSRFAALAAGENLDAVKAADVTGTGRMRMFNKSDSQSNSSAIVDISREFLNSNGAEQKTTVKVMCAEKLDTKPEAGDLRKMWLDNLGDINVACQKGLSEQFDSTVGGNTVLMPFGGLYQLTPGIVMAAKIPVESGLTNTVSLMSFGFDLKTARVSPFHSALYAVVESVSRIVAAGGKYESVRLSFQEYFESLGTDPEKWGKPFSALLGAFLAQMKLGLPAIGGKDSMSGTFNDINVPPTLVSFAVTAADARNVISPEFKAADNNIVDITTPLDADGLPDFEALKKTFEIIHNNISCGIIISAHTIGYGGIAEAISKMCFGNKIGAEIVYDDVNCLFTAKPGSFILECACNESRIDEIFGGIGYKLLGKTSAEKIIAVNGLGIDIDEALEHWLNPLEGIFPTRYYSNTEKTVNASPYNKSVTIHSKQGFAKPNVLIPVFPGSNCEYETALRYKECGANVKTLIVKNLTTGQFAASVKDMAGAIKESQIISIPGGFSAGDEPEGSGKFISAVFRNEYIKDAMHELLNNRDGLILGICNGFQALVKLGLLPYGQICDITVADSPTLTFNAIGRHISCMARTKVVSKLSPWLAGAELGEINTIAFSHGEGRFIAGRDMFDRLCENGQIAAQYVDFDGNAAMDIKHNPNGSMFAVEAISSPDGRVLGKMGHNERYTGGLLKNVPGNKDQNIFRSGVRYFL